MTAKTVVAISSLAVAVTTAGCMNFYEIPVEIPIQAKIDVSSFQRVLVAGFVTGGTKNIDPNTETARLLRSQLRTKSDMRVIDAEVISLVDEVDKRRAAAGQGPAVPGPPTPDEPKIKSEKDLPNYEAIFSDADYWKKIGAEYQNPLIVTGTVMFTEISKSGVVSSPQTTIDAQGNSHYQEVRAFRDLKGYALVPKFVFIDGRTGQQLYNETFHEESLYPAGNNTPALSSYFELMDKLLPSFLNTLSSQKIKGSRVLLK